MAKKANLSISLGVDIEGLKKGFEEAIKVTQSAGKTTEAQAKQMADGIVSQLNKIGQQSTMRGAIRQMENLAGQMQAVGLEGSKAFNEVISQTGKLKASQSDLKDLIEASRPDAPFKAMSNALQASAQAFAGVTGAMTLFGVESEDAQKTLIKLQAALALAEGTKAIDGLQDSFKQLNMVMQRNPAIAIAAAVAAIGVAVYGLNSLLNHQVDTYAALNSVQQKAFDATVKERTELEYYKDRLNDANISQEERKNLLSEISKKYPEYLGKLNQEGITQTEINNAINSYINLLELKAKAQAAQELYVEALKAEQKAEKDARDSKLKSIVAGSAGNSVAAGFYNLLSKYETQVNANAKADADYFKQLYSGYQKAADAAGNFQKKTFGNSPTPPTTAPAKSTVTPIDWGGQTQGIKAGASALEEYAKAQNNVALSAIYSDEQLLKMHKSLKMVHISAEDFTKALQQGATRAISDMAAAMGNALVTGENLAQAIGTAFLTAFAGFMKMMGEMFIQAGIQKLIFDTMILTPGMAGVAIAAGAALVAASSAMLAGIQKKSAPKKFASGGMVNSPTFAMIGDNMNAQNNPEFVLRRDQLSRIFNNNFGNAMQLIPLIDDRGISILAENGNRRRGR